MVAKVSGYNSDDKFPKIGSDVRKMHCEGSEMVKNKGSDSIFCVFQAIPPVRRISSLPDKVQNGDLLPAVGITAVTVANLPSDFHDMKEVGKQVSMLLNGESHSSVLEFYRNQKHFRFLNGTLFQIPMDLLHQTHPELAKKILGCDKSFFETGVGSALIRFLRRFDENLANFSARAFKRATVLGMVVLSLFEIPKIFKCITKAKSCDEKIGSGVKQTVKSGAVVLTASASIAYMGALGAKYGGLFGSVAGMGAGAVLGSYLSEKIT